VRTREGPRCRRKVRSKKRAKWVLGRTLVFHFTFKLARGPFCRSLPPIRATALPTAYFRRVRHSHYLISTVTDSVLEDVVEWWFL
jgi:hypothetical protein